ncbi:MAG: hypothetical protein ICV60_17820 [Pyrinomonadaceae bacterium]|nr:hypothetical protein [Pyrinomonadaceae bacterium]
MTEKAKKEQPQPLDLDTGERLAMTGRAVAQGIAHEIKGEHESQKGARYALSLAEVDKIIEDWPAPQKNIAQQMIEKYGTPNEATATKLFWYENGPWKRTELSRDIVVHNWPTVHTDFLTQVIDYRVPPEMFHLIAMFDGSILLDRTKGEVAARCDSESANVLGMNMVHEIVTGKRTVEDARKTAVESTVAYNLGRSAPYAERLLFEVPQGGTEDLDKSEVSGAILRQTGGKIKDVVTGHKEEATDRLTGPGAPKDS